MSNQRVETWLRERGYHPEPEPEWLQGQKPDFFCPGAQPLWVEVKTFEPSTHDQTQAWAWDDFRSRVANIRHATGEVYAIVAQNYTEAHGKLGAHLLRQLSRSPAPSSSDLSEVIIIPPDPSPDATIVTIRYESKDGDVIQTGPKTVSCRYGYYPSYDPQNWGQDVEICLCR